MVLLLLWLDSIYLQKFDYMWTKPSICLVSEHWGEPSIPFVPCTPAINFLNCLWYHFFIYSQASGFVWFVGWYADDFSSFSVLFLVLCHTEAISLSYFPALALQGFSNVYSKGPEHLWRVYLRSFIPFLMDCRQQQWILRLSKRVSLISSVLSSSFRRRCLPVPEGSSPSFITLCSKSIMWLCGDNLWERVNGWVQNLLVVAMPQFLKSFYQPMLGL